jgi:hypothetical protein
LICTADNIDVADRADRKREHSQAHSGRCFLKGARDPDQGQQDQNPDHKKAFCHRCIGDMTREKLACSVDRIGQGG